MFDVCTWPADVGCLGDEWENLDPELKARSLALATSSLISLTGGRVGKCPVTIRPCQPVDRCNPWDRGSLYSYGPGFWPLNWNGVWFNCGCGSQCACDAACQIKIPGPIGEIYSIKVDGTELNTDFIRIDNGNILVWEHDGECPFPKAQNMSLPDSEPGTFSITYQNSYPVDSSGELAVAMLALEFSRACVPKKKCSLPRGVTSVVRSGVTFEIEAGLFPNGETGIDIVDAFIQKWMPPGSPKQAATIYSPGMANPRRTRSRSGGSGGSW